MHLILTGATGRVGSSVLDAMLKSDDISRITILSRRPVKMAEDAKDPRVNVIIHKDYNTYDESLLKQLAGARGCVWSLGCSQHDVPRDEYVKITRDYAREAAKAFAPLATRDDEPFRFVYVSSEGATHTPSRLTPVYARWKGETEVLLAEMSTQTPRLKTYSGRPLFVDVRGHEAILPYIPKLGYLYRYSQVFVGPAITTFLRHMHSPTEPLGRFFTQLAQGKLDGQLEGPGAFKKGEGWIVGNVAFRRIMGVGVS